MTSKEYLRSIRNTDAEIQALKEQIALLRAEAEGVKAVTISDMPRGGKTKDAADLVAEVADLQYICADKMAKYIKDKQLATEIIMDIPSSEYRTVLILRYLCGKQWGEIANSMGYSEPGIYKIHGAALLAFDERWQ